MTASEIVIREVAPGVWTFSAPFTRFGFVPFGGRSTAIKMKNGGVWVLASTTLDTETKSVLDKLGPVQYIVGVNAFHYLYLGEYKRAYPNAKLIAPQAAIENLKDPNLKFDGAWGKDSANTRYGFETDVIACYFSGFKNKDVVFYHPNSKTIIEGDLLFNLPCNEQFSKSKSSGKLSLLAVSPDSWLHPKIVWSSGIDKDAMRRDVKTVASWDFDRIIPCHGDVVEKDGKKAWNTVFKPYYE